MIPNTPHRPRNASDLSRFITDLNRQFGLEIPTLGLHSPSAVRDKSSLRWRCFLRLLFLYFKDQTQLRRAVDSLAEWIGMPQAVPVPVPGTGPGPGPGSLTNRDKDERMAFLLRGLEDHVYLLSRGSPTSLSLQQFDVPHVPHVAESALSPRKRRFSDEDNNNINIINHHEELEDELEFHTAPNSPSKSQCPSNLPHLPPIFDSVDRDHDLDHDLDLHLDPTRLFCPNKTPSLQRFKQSQPNATVTDRINTSFHTVSTASTALNSSSSFFPDRSTIDHSFDTEITVPDGTQSTYPDSVGLFTDVNLDIDVDGDYDGPHDYLNQSFQDRIVQELVDHGPFSLHHPFPGKLPLRYRYEFERLGRAWKIPLQRVYRGDVASWKSHDDFWAWVQRHNQRCDQPLPPKSSRRAWDHAINDFKTDAPSEVVILTGEFNWCLPGEPGILKLDLNPLKTEKTCRFHRRFGSDRFMSLSIPAPSHAPNHLSCTDLSSGLREPIARWLTENDHHCLGRKWRPFFVEEVKSKRKVKAEPRFRVEFFAIDGVDFQHQHIHDIPLIAPALQRSDSHSPMTVGNLLEWHMPQQANSRQLNCKLFQRLSLGLSKTLASVVLRPTQIVRLRDRPTWKMVMNDGCALMSRALALKICDSIGITEPTPSCFQARIAGAKGLWMVDRHQSSIRSFSHDLGFAIEDSPPPQEMGDAFDPEQLTFEVVNWAKPLHSVDLNIQLLAILHQGGNVKQHLAKLTRDGIDELYDDLAHVLQSDNPVLCRSLLQKLRPSGDDGANKLRRLEQWVVNDAEFIIRLSEAGFAPQTFYPLRKRLGQLMCWLLERHVEELRIQVPLSTYAYCIADPYDILEPDEVHFGFSTRWKDPDRQFEDTQLEGVDVLVGRLPAHVPSDIQRRKAVWKPELRHFQDIIVFPRKGNIALAHMLSGGDYDGDTPWICWDPQIVQKAEFGADHFGLTSHSLPMNQVQSTDAFLLSTFEFNLTCSSLGRCTVEHEKIAYDESINSPKAIELANLLSHLVDGRKGGVHLSEQAWQAYRKKISPRQRALPAYRNPGRNPKTSNIVDYLKFNVAKGHAHVIRERLEREFPEGQGSNEIDEDLARPSRKAWEVACIDRQQGGELQPTLQQIQSTIDQLCDQWKRAFRNGTEGFPIEARQAIESACSLCPPSSGFHPILHTWQNSPDEWRRLLASCAYVTHPHSSFIFHAFGETLCQLKTEAVPSRLVTHDVLACYRMNQKTVAQLTEAGPPGEEEDDDQYEGKDAIETFFLGTDIGYHDGVDDDEQGIE
ncbi:hypothetical protein N7509_001464 [Penicillium cosmopolitanum]|uniref:RNA-dependent RNA polymerase n=1 Tax=Penicillium cosmopolitanum TaxID=1131564 RepID=A0A9X0BCI0_9EURO|nr:uncharacterized protein N7509_001464 [Penicillium cosmopolitanum]KAJ5407581.1 hypothetical protein N7509_001464 [Penicillium cosmopolitanum]